MAEKTSNWSEIKKRLEPFDKKELINVIKDLHSLSKENKNFLSARFASDKNQIFKKYKEKVVEPFYPANGRFGSLKLAPAKKAINDYKKASNDLLGTLDLMLTYVESGTEFTCEYGDIDENFYNSLESVLFNFQELISSKSEDYLDDFKDRLIKLRNKASGLGWGYGDTVDEIIDELGI